MAASHPPSCLRCALCGAYQVYRSAPRGFVERFLLPLLLLRPVRCGHCFRRGCRLFFLARQRQEPKPLSRSAAAGD